MAAVPRLPDENWRPARLLTTIGIRGEQEQERRATSALLAVMAAVPEFGRVLLNDVGAPGGRIKTFCEVRLKDPTGKLWIPDGAILVERGKARWTALVEVKTGTHGLRDDQVTAYVERARDSGFDAVITISNQITAQTTECPVHVKRPPKKVAIRHLSWWRVITEAVLQHRHRGISDPDQAWILGELIDYLEHPNSGAGAFQDMGESWVDVRDAVRNGTARVGDENVRKVVQRWDQFVDYLALGLAQDLGQTVEVARTRKGSAVEREREVVRALAEAGLLGGTLRVPDAVAPIQVNADVRARQVTCSVAVSLPTTGRPATRVGWVVKQLREARDDVRLEVSFAGSRETTSALLAQVRDLGSDALLSTLDRKREPRMISVAAIRPMGLKRGSDKGSFVGDTRSQLIAFYREIVQGLRAWQAPAPTYRPRDDAQPGPGDDGAISFEPKPGPNGGQAAAVIDPSNALTNAPTLAGHDPDDQ